MNHSFCFFFIFISRFIIPFLKSYRQSKLYKSGHFSSKLTVTITHRKEMAMFQAHDMRWSNIRILVCLVWIVSCNTSFRCEREFSNDIANFGFTCWRLVLADSGRGVILRLTIACLVSWHVLTLLWVWFLHIVLRYLLKVIVQLLHLLHLLLHPQLLWVCLNTLQALALCKSPNVESLKRLTCFVGGRG